MFRLGSTERVQVRLGGCEAENQDISGFEAKPGALVQFLDFTDILNCFGVYFLCESSLSGCVVVDYLDFMDLCVVLVI